MTPKDLNMISNIEEMINIGVNSFKVEGRMRSNYYVATVINTYRNMIDDYYDGKLITDPEWFYIWNGVYINPDYALDVDGTTVNGFANINGAYAYLTGETGHPDASGGILNFYGGELNPVATGKNPDKERAVEVKECITVFAPDNGTPPEFLDKEDLAWTYTPGW